jgi:hypothetical protein
MILRRQQNSTLRFAEKAERVYITLETIPCFLIQVYIYLHYQVLNELNSSLDSTVKKVHRFSHVVFVRTAPKLFVLICIISDKGLY